MVQKEKTIRTEVCFRGKALQTGRNVEMRCKSQEAGSGIVFKRTDLDGSPEIRLSEITALGGYKRRSTIAAGAAEVQTVEHFLAALWALEIDNLMVEVTGKELPATDGSALGFLRPLKEVGLVEQEKNREYIKIEEPIEIADTSSALSIFPAEDFRVSYEIDYKVPSIKKETFELELTGDTFEKEIAPARTFCTKKEALLLFLCGIGRGANFNNTLILGNKGPVGTSFRFTNEPVRHKVLDLVGDLYMLGKPIIGRVVARKSGHKLNAEMVKMIYDKYLKVED